MNSLKCHFKKKVLIKADIDRVKCPNGSTNDRYVLLIEILHYTASHSERSEESLFLFCFLLNFFVNCIKMIL